LIIAIPYFILSISTFELSYLLIATKNEIPGKMNSLTLKQNNARYGIMVLIYVIKIPPVRLSKIKIVVAMM